MIHWCTYFAFLLYMHVMHTLQHDLQSVWSISTQDHNSRFSIFAAGQTVASLVLPFTVPLICRSKEIVGWGGENLRGGGSNKKEDRKTGLYKSKVLSMFVFVFLEPWTWYGGLSELHISAQFPHFREGMYAHKVCMCLYHNLMNEDRKSSCWMHIFLHMHTHTHTHARAHARTHTVTCTKYNLNGELSPHIPPPPSPPPIRTYQTLDIISSIGVGIGYWFLRFEFKG